MQHPSQTALHTESPGQNIKIDVPENLWCYSSPRFAQDLHLIPHCQQHFDYFQAGNENMEIKLCPHVPQFTTLSVLGKTKAFFFFFQCRFRSEPDMPWMFYLNFLEFGLMITYKNICLASLIFIPWNRGTFNGRLVHSHYNIKLNNAAPKWSAWLS